MTGTRDGDAVVLNTTARADHDWIDRVLAQQVTRPRWRISTYASTEIVLGCAQRATADDRRRAAAAGIGLSIRPTGGGAVLVGPWMLGATVALPAADPRAALPLSTSYRWLGQVFVDWLASLGIAAQALPVAQAASPNRPWACFAALSWWEVSAERRKLVGLAQKRGRHGVLYSAAALLAPPPWSLLCEVLDKPADDAARLVAATSSCASLLARPLDPSSTAASLGEFLAETFHVHAR